MTRRRGVRGDEAQLVLDLDARQHPAVEHAREVRAEAGLPESLTAAEVLVLVRTILDGGQRADRHRGHTPDRKAS
jgi:hypothetical protein